MNIFITDVQCEEFYADPDPEGFEYLEECAEKATDEENARMDAYYEARWEDQNERGF